MKPESPFLDRHIDKEISSLVDALNQFPYISTVGSCSGHGKEMAYIDLGVRGFDGLKKLSQLLNRVINDWVDGPLYFHLEIIWDESIATSPDWEAYPEWITLSLRIEHLLDTAPTAENLNELATHVLSCCGNS